MSITRLLVVAGIKQNPAAIVFGADPHGFAAQRQVITEGTHSLGPKEILVGDHLATQLNVHPGSTLTVKNTTFKVSGVYHSGVFFEDSGATVDLGVAQRLEHRSGDATTIAVQLAPGVPWAGFHAFRHTCATRLFAEGRNAVQVSRWLGHHSPAFTLSVYVGLLDGDLGTPLASSPNGSPRAALRALEGASIGSAQATDSRGITAQRVA